MGAEDDVLTRVEKDTDRWMALQQQLTDEQNKWKSDKELLHHSVIVLKAEQASLQEKISSYKLATHLYERNRNRVFEELDQENVANAVLSGDLSKFEERIRDLQARLPDPLKGKLEPLFLSSTKSEGEKGNSVANRSQSLISIITTIDQFANALNLTHAVRESADGKEIDVKVLYWGLAFAFASDEKGTLAWLLKPGTSGWEWVAYHDRAADFKNLIAVYENERQPDLIDLPAAMN